MKIFLRFIGWAAIFFAASAAFCQPYPINISVVVNPPYSPYVSDYLALEGHQVFILTNTGPGRQELKLAGTLNANNGISAHTDPSYRPPQPIVLEGFETRTILADNEVFGIHRSDIIHNLSAEQENNILLLGTLPEGVYTYCLQALDFLGGQPLSGPMTGCAIIPISYPEPPMLLNPVCGTEVFQTIPQNLVFSWSPVANQAAGAIIAYDLYLLKLANGQDPQDAMNAAIQFNSGNPVKIADIFNTNYIFTPAGLELEPGSYAWAVVVRDISGQSVFQNNGISQVCSFLLRDASGLDGGEVQVPPAGICGCQAAFPADHIVKSSIVKPGSTVMVGNFEMTVVEVSPFNGKLKGMGKINLPVANTQFLPIRVSFENMSVNATGQMLEGAVTAMKRPDGAGLMPAFNPLTPSLMPFSSSQAEALDQYFQQNVSQLSSQAAAAAQSIGLELPLGIDKNTSPYTIAIMDLRWTPLEAVFDAAVAVPLPDGNTTIALGARNVCVSPDNLCGQGILYLAQDLGVPLISLKLIGADPNDLAGNPGTYVVFDKDGFSSLHVKAEYAFPNSLILRKDNTGQVVATLEADCQKWTDWIAGVNLPEFFINGLNDFSFNLQAGGWYDHSSLQNPPGLPEIPEKPNLATPDWMGFYLQELQVKMPEVFKTIGGQPVSFSANDLVIDGQGVSGNLQANNLLTLDQGTLGGWYFSMDHIGLKFLNNSFVSGGLNGRLVLPISGNNTGDPNTQLDYTCTLSHPAGQMNFQFVIQLKNNLQVPIWYARADIRQGSNITVSVAGGAFEAVATLSGGLNIEADIAPVGPIRFAQLEFENMRISTKPQYFLVDKFYTGLNSPQRYLSGSGAEDAGGFPVSLDHVSLQLSGNKAGIQFDLSLSLADIDKLPKATATFTLWSKIEFAGGRPKWAFSNLEAKKVKVKGPVGPVQVDGEIEFYSGDPKFGNGVAGALKANMIGVGEVNAKALFGKKDFFYWYVDANIILPPPGITLCTPPGPPVSIIGFGGGAYYNLAQNYPPGSVVDPNSDLRQRYNPQPGYGFKGSMYLSSNDGQLYIAKGTFTVELTAQLAPLTMSIETNGAMFRTDPADMNFDNAMVKVDGALGYHFQQNILHGELWVDFNPIPPFFDSPRQKLLSLHVDGNNKLWHLKIGDVDPANRLNVLIPPVPPILFPFNLGIYMMAGNYQVPPVVQPPEPIRTALAENGINYNGYRLPDIPTGGSLLFGGAYGYPPTSFNFLAFKMNAGAQIGFDMSLTKFDTDCDGNPNGALPGLNGWYTSGQLWGYVTGSLALTIDDFGLNGDIELFKVTAAMLVNGGMPNPTWGKGIIAGNYEVLGGKVKGSVAFEMQYSSSNKPGCLALQTDPLKGMRIMENIDPAAGATDVSIGKNVSVSLNLAVNQEFAVNFANTGGSIRTETYRVVLEEMRLWDKKRNQLFAGANPGLP
ncbi:MAG: hypothetical protein EPO28_14440, partial [Saprospiraceae bacterium]